MKLGKLLRDKRMLLIGGAAALGIGVLVAFRGRGGSSAPKQAMLDTTPQDFSSAMSAAQESWAADLREFSGTLQDVLDRLNRLPGNNPTPLPAPVTRPVGRRPRPESGPTRVVDPSRPRFDPLTLKPGARISATPVVVPARRR